MSLDVLVVDDEKDIRDLISDILKDDGYNPIAANDSTTALEAVNDRVPAAVILDIWLQGSQLDGLGILENLKKNHPDLPVIMISGHGNIETAINSIKLGAYDYIEKPFKEDRLLRLVKRAIETASLKNENEQLKIRGGFENKLIGNSTALNNLKNTILRVASTESRVLINGPAGCGKEVTARIIHQQSNRKNGPFIVLNAASISPDRVEEELFGIEEQSGNGQTQKRKIGTFEKAHGGTLFLDEVADMPLSTQGKILRFLQDNSFERIGSTRKIHLNARVISATNRDLKEEIAKGKFREDLYYRLNVVPLTVPSLSERKGDLVPLVNYFVKRCSDVLGLTPRVINNSAIAAMEMYSWPGNVRQLKNAIEWMLIMAPDDNSIELDSTMLPPDIISNSPLSESGILNAEMLSLSLRSAREVFEKQYLTAQLDRFNGNVSKTAIFVGMERSAFHRKIKSLNINNNEEKILEEA